jgi:hypothetical protein
MSTVQNKLIDPDNENSSGLCVHPEALATIRERGGQWAVYQNHDLGSRKIGHLKFLKYGIGCTFDAPPPHYPDPTISEGTNYLLVGRLDTISGVIKDV